MKETSQLVATNMTREQCQECAHSEADLCAMHKAFMECFEVTQPDDHQDGKGTLSAGQVLGGKPEIWKGNTLSHWSLADCSK